MGIWATQAYTGQAGIELGALTAPQCLRLSYSKGKSEVSCTVRGTGTSGILPSATEEQEDLYLLPVIKPWEVSLFLLQRAGSSDWLPVPTMVPLLKRESVGI